MKSNEREKQELFDKLKQAVKTCGTLKIGKKGLNEAFVITLIDFLDMTEDKYIDGKHSFRMDASVKVKDKNHEEHDERCEIHFSATVKGTDVTIEDDMLIVDGNAFSALLMTGLL